MRKRLQDKRKLDIIKVLKRSFLHPDLGVYLSPKVENFLPSRLLEVIKVLFLCSTAPQNTLSTLSFLDECAMWLWVEPFLWRSQ